MLSLIKQSAGTKLIKPMAEWSCGPNVEKVEMGFRAQAGGGEGGGWSGGVYVAEHMRAVNLWAVGVHYWIEIVGAVCLLVILFAFVRWWRERRLLRDVQVGEAYCSKCGYGLSGLKDGGG